jgi:hypothetical protein
LPTANGASADTPLTNTIRLRFALFDRSVRRALGLSRENQ